MLCALLYLKVKTTTLIDRDISQRKEDGCCIGITAGFGHLIVFALIVQVVI